MNEILVDHLHLGIAAQRQEMFAHDDQRGGAGRRTVKPAQQLLPARFGAEETDGAQRVLVVPQEASAEQAVEVAERLRAQGIPAELELSGRSDAEAAKLAKQRGIQTVMRVGADGGVAEKNV